MRGSFLLDIVLHRNNYYKEMMLVWFMRGVYLTDVSFIPDEGLLWVDTSGFAYVGHGVKPSPAIEDAKLAKIVNCLKVFRSRSGGVVASEGIMNELADSVEYYSIKKARTRKKMSESRRIKRGFYKQCRARSCPSNLIHVLRKNKNSLKVYRSLHGFLDNSRKQHPLGMSDEESGEIMSYICGRRGAAKLSPVDKGLLVDSIYSGDGGGVFSSDLLVLDFYRDAVRDFSLDGCFVCDGVRARTDRLG